jgi:hypothetical protein
MKNIVVEASGLAGNDKINPYCEVVILDTKGNQMGKPKNSKVVKGKDPKWNEQVELYFLPPIYYFFVFTCLPCI